MNKDSKNDFLGGIIFDTEPVEALFGDEKPIREIVYDLQGNEVKEK